MPNEVAEHGLVLSKPRLKWTQQLHQRFVDAVTQLGGADSESQLFDARNLPQYHIALLFIVSCSRLFFLCFLLFMNYRSNPKISDASHGDSWDNSLPFEEPFAGINISLRS